MNEPTPRQLERCAAMGWIWDPELGAFRKGDMIGWFENGRFFKA